MRGCACLCAFVRQSLVWLSKPHGTFCVSIDLSMLESRHGAHADASGMRFRIAYVMQGILHLQCATEAQAI